LLATFIPSSKSKVHRAAFSPGNDNLAVTAGGDNIIRLWNPSTGAELTNAVAGEQEISDAEFSPDGKQIVTASGDGTARIFDVQQSSTGAWSLEEKPAHMQHDGWVPAAKFDSRGDMIATVSLDGKARLWNSEGAAIGTPFTATGRLRAVAISPDDTQLVTGGCDGTLQLWDISRHAEVRRVTLGYTIWSVVYNRAGTRILTASNQFAAQLWDANTLAKVQTLSHPKTATDAIFAPGERQIAVAAANGTAYIWDITRPADGTVAGVGQGENPTPGDQC
jgi:WD40 repeat protein